MPKPQVLAGSWREKCEAKQRLKQAVKLQASDCRLDKSADTGEQTFTSQMLLSTLALDDGLRTALRQMSWGSEKRSWLKRAALQPLAVNCCQIMLDSSTSSTSAHLINLFACSKLVHLIAINQVAIKATNSTQGPGDHKLAMGSGTGYMIHAWTVVEVVDSISKARHLMGALSKLVYVPPFNKHPEKQKKLKGLKGSRLSSLDSPTRNSRRTFRIPS